MLASRFYPIDDRCQETDRASGIAELSDRSYAAALSLRGMTVELWLILAYAVAIAVGDLRVAKLGFQIGPIPVFLTDITLGALLLSSFARWPSRILFWMSEGAGAGIVGRLVWMICILGGVYFALSISEYSLYAARDLAIFGYSLFFPLTYFALRERSDGVRLLRYITYAGVALAVMVLFQLLTGIQVGLGTGERTVMGHTIHTVADEDSGAFCVFSLAALCAYVTFERRQRLFHALAATACFVALVISTSRAGVVALVVAASVTFLCAGAKERLRLTLLTALFAIFVAAAPLLPRDLPGTDFLRGFRISLLSATEGPSGDPTSEFRMIRWDYATALWLEHPFLGIGFGHPIIPAGLLEKKESEGRFNAGMPHNTFLFLAVRAGLLGLGIVLLGWLIIFKRLFIRFRSTNHVDELAAANILAAMFCFAMFSLFFERPVTNAAFWIILAVGARLAEYREDRPFAACSNVREPGHLRRPQLRAIRVPRVAI